jgi:hypothetical protein
VRDREITSDQTPPVATIGINEENLRFDDLPRDREKVLSKNFRFLFSILEEGGKKALASKLGIDPTTVSWPPTRDYTQRRKITLDQRPSRHVKAGDGGIETWWRLMGPKSVAESNQRCHLPQRCRGRPASSGGRLI